MTKEECREVISLGQEMPAKLGTVGKNEHKINFTLRNNLVSFFSPHDIRSIWIFEKVMDAMTSINQQFWQFDITEIESMQFTIYNEIGHFYFDHMDMSWTDVKEQRKLSASVQLTDPDEYEGSNLEFKCGAEFVAAPREQGSLIVFPSFLLHRVTALTRGTRHSLVAWSTGPRFK